MTTLPLRTSADASPGVQFAHASPSPASATGVPRCCSGGPEYGLGGGAGKSGSRSPGWTCHSVPSGWNQGHRPAAILGQKPVLKMALQIALTWSALGRLKPKSLMLWA